MAELERLDYYGQVRPPDSAVLAHIRNNPNESVPRQFFKAPPSSGVSREAAIVLTIAAALVLIVGVLRWTSLESQMIRGFGGNDGLGLTLLIVGIGGLLLGGVLLASPRPPAVESSTATPQPPITPQPAPTAESRLRQLEDLKAKGLITEAEYRQRREDLLSSL